MSPTDQSELVSGALACARLETQLECLEFLGSGSSSATESASSLPALRNDSGEAVWRLTEKAREYLRGLQGLPFRTVDEVLSPLAPRSEQCDTGDTSKASKP